MRRSDQRRAAVIALYQHDLTGRPLSQTLLPATPKLGVVTNFTVDGTPYPPSNTDSTKTDR